MFVGVCKLELFIPNSHSLKSKRMVGTSIIKRVQNKFNVSISEIDENEKWQKMSLGIAIVCNERKFIDKTMNKIFKLIEYDGRAEILNHLIELY